MKKTEILADRNVWRIRPAKKNGAMRILKELLDTDYFNQPKSIGELTAFLNATYEPVFYANQLSGLLRTMVNRRQLDRSIHPETGRYVYLRFYQLKKDCAI